MPKKEKSKQEKLPPIVREVPDPPVPNRAHTEMKSEPEKGQDGKQAQSTS